MKNFLSLCLCIKILFSSYLHAQSPGIQLLQIQESAPVLTGDASSFQGGMQEFSGTQATTYAFQHNADSFYVARFAPFTATNDEPMLVYVKCYFPGASFSGNSQNYDGFTPNFSGLGGVNFVAYMKPGYDEFRFWNGTSWSAANTSLRPFFKRTSGLGTRFEVAIPWSAMMAEGGIPDSVKVVCYQTNGNAGSIFSYAQLPKLLPAGALASPSVNQAHLIRVKNIVSMVNPYRFNKTKTGQQNGLYLRVYNSGNANLTIDTTLFTSGIPSNQSLAFTVQIQSAKTIPPKKSSPLYIEFAPQIPLITYEATGSISNNSNGNFAFKVLGASVGEPDVAVLQGTSTVSPNDPIEFGSEIPENTARIVDIQVNSTGQDTLEIGPFISSNAAVFEVVSTSKTSLPPGENAQVKLRFKPQPAGAYTGKINLGLNLSENSYRIDLRATVVAGSGGLLNVYQIPNRRIRIDGDATTQWLPSEKTESGTSGLDWYVTWNADSLYLARVGGNNAEPQIINIQSLNPEVTPASTSFSYDGITTNFESQGKMNFVAYLKNNYDEYRTTNSFGQWGPAFTNLTPRYSTQGSTAHMEIAIPWAFITQSVGIPDSFKLVLFQGNGNAGSPFVYGIAPSTLTGGAVSVIQATGSIARQVAKPITESEPFDFGDVPVGTNADTTLLVYNKGTATVTGITPIDFSNTAFSALSNPAQSLTSRRYTRSKIRFSPVDAGNQETIGSISGESGPITSTTTFKIIGNGISGPTANATVRAGQTVFQSNDTLRFGSLSFGQVKDTTLWVKNTGTDTLRITNPTLTGSGYTHPNTYALKIAPGDSVAIGVRFSSSAPAGIKHGRLTLPFNVSGLTSFLVNLKATSTVPVVPESVLEIRHIANNLINTSGAIPASQLKPTFLLSDNAGIKWYATWDTAHLYVVKIGGNRAEPQLVYIRASYPGAVFTDSPTIYDGFHPIFTGMGGINFSAYFKETTVPYDEFRNWNGTLWLAPDQGLQPLYGNQGADLFAVRIPWNSITQGNGIPDSLRMVMYQTNGNPASFFAYGQSPAGLPSGNAVTPPITQFHSRKIITRLPNNAEFDFGNVSVGSSVDTCFLFQNEGSAGSSLTTNGPSTVTGSSFSASLQTVAGTVVPSKKWAVMKVRFTPSSQGSFTGTVTANATYNNPASPYKINLKGKGVPAPQAGIVIKLGGQVIGPGMSGDLGVAETGTTLDTMVQVVNTGEDTLRISNNSMGFTTPGWSLNGLAFFKVAPADSAAIRFRKLGVSPGLDAVNFGMNTNVPGQPSFNFSVLLRGDSALSWFPPFPTINDSVTITYNSSMGNKGLKDLSPPISQVYIHTGVVTSGPTGTNWENVQGTFNIPADSVRLRKLERNLYRTKIRIRDFYNLTGNPTVYRLGMVFRNDIGTRVGKTRTDGDFFIPVNPNTATAQIRVRTSSGRVLNNNDTIQFGILPYGAVRDTTVTIKNTGVVPLVFSLINVASFSFTQIGTTPLTVAPGDSITVAIQLNVNGAGPLEGFLNLVSNASNSPTLLVNLVATGVVSNQKILSDARFRIQPNPTRGLLYPRFSSQVGSARYSFLDMAGRPVLTGTWTEGEPIDARSLPSGLWMIHLETQDGSIWRKVVKE